MHVYAAQHVSAAHGLVSLLMRPCHMPGSSTPASRFMFWCSMLVCQLLRPLKGTHQFSIPSRMSLSLALSLIIIKIVCLFACIRNNKKKTRKVGDHIIIKCPWKRMKETTFWRCFLTSWTSIHLFIVNGRPSVRPQWQHSSATPPPPNPVLAVTWCLCLIYS